MNLSKKTRILIGIVALSLISFVVVYQVVYKAHDQIEDQTVSFTGTADDLKQKVSNEAEKLQNAYIQITGVVASIDELGVTLNQSVYCLFKEVNVVGKINLQDEITVKARFIGYDDLLEEIRLDQCILINK